MRTDIKILNEVGLTDAPPADYKAYFSGMSKGVSDKLFFLNHILPDLIVDYGSADGYLLKEIKQKYPNIRLIGYDISPEMIKISRNKNPDIAFTNDWNRIPPISRRFKNSCLLLSSVIHEVYSYSDNNGVDKFWKEIFNAGFEYIVIRDTIPPAKLEKVNNFKKDSEKVKSIVDPLLLADYEQRWGPIEKDYKNFVRFILMYRYKKNWQRERLEDYLPLTYETFLMRVSEDYKIIYNKSYKFKPIERSFTKDFGVSLRGDTHLKIILRKK